MTRGIRQGCPISALLYIFVAEILAKKINDNTEIHGFQKSSMEKEIKNIQHADDLTVALKDTLSLKKTLDTIHEFCSHAGSKINLAKTECILLGNLKGLYNELYGVKVNNKSIKVLGIHIGHDKNEYYNNNWTKVYNDMQKLFESWKRRKLTLFGKTCIINTLGISKLIYRASILQMPGEDFFKKTSKLIFNFLWNNRERIKRNTLIGPIAEGGIGLVDLETKFKALKDACVTRLVRRNSNLNVVLNSFCADCNIDLNYVLKTNVRKYSDFNIVKSLPTFYKEVFCSFNESKTILPFNRLNDDLFLQQPIWNNLYFIVNRKPLLFRNWLNSGIMYVKDLYDNGGNFHSIMHFQNIIVNKSNWLCEYKVLKNVFARFSARFDGTKGQYINIVKKQHFLFCNKYEDICTKKSYFFYDILLKRKFQKPCYQSILARDFDITGSIWQTIYDNKVKHILDRDIAEFNYKILNNLICTNYYLSKWKVGQTKYCKICTNEVEYTKHLIYNCSITKRIWNIVSFTLKFEVEWKHIVLGFYNSKSDYIDFLNYLISFIACKIYKYRMFCRLESLDENTYNISTHLKVSLNLLQRIYHYKKYRFRNIIKTITDVL